MESHLLQMRGLKRNVNAYQRYLELSHLLQMRGLKPVILLLLSTLLSSHLLQMRGLKLPLCHACRMLVCRIFYRCVD